MKRPLAGLRLGVILLFLLGFLSPIATIGAGAQTFSCEDLTATQAQALLDADPDLEDDLDPDGDGEACNHEDGNSGQDDEPAAGDDEYLAAVQDELDYLGDTFDRFLELNDEAETADEADLADIVDEINAIVADWVEYPDVAADLVAPEGLEDIEDAYLDLADLVGEAGELWEEYWAIPAGDPEEEAAFDAFIDAFIDVQDQLDLVQTLVDDASGSGGSTDPDATEEVTEEATEEGTEEAIVEGTEETVEATDEATEAATDEATEAATDEATESATEEATEEPAEAATEEATQEATEEAGGGFDTDAYTAGVPDAARALLESVDRFNELLRGDLTDADIDELSKILFARYADRITPGTGWISPVNLKVPATA